MTLTRTLLVSLVGPVAALAVTWYASLLIAHTPAGKTPDAHTIARLRTVPDDTRLKELAAIGVMYPKFDDTPDEEVLAMADRLFSGGYTPEGVHTVIRVPFEPQPWLFDRSSWLLEIQSFWTPALLACAHEISGKQRYITAAVQYVVAWGKYESSLPVPRGYFFNDHALAARAIVLSELWRLYRGSTDYRPDLAADFLRYARRLSRLLLEERLYEYRSNHGVMQCLALMHLATAFPSLEDFEHLFDIGWKRLEFQLGFYVDAEGVILEHSPGYHFDGLRMLAAAWRLMGMNHRAVAPEWIDRYRKAVQFAAALRRPDGTLPPVGDTHDAGYFPLDIAEFDPDGVVSRPLREITATELQPPAVTLAPGAGYAITWHGGAQTVFHWGNFATGIHKHADELGLSLWSDGTQWIRPIGYWPYIASRREAISWRSSNAPHWLGEQATSVRTSTLQSYSIGDDGYSFTVTREDTGGNRIRRQVTQSGPGKWAVVDSFDSPDKRKGEIIWRFPPEVTLESLPEGMSLTAGDKRMTVQISAAPGLLVEMDAEGTQHWNSGLVRDRKIVPSPALRIQTDGSRPVVTTFTLHPAGSPATAADAGRTAPSVIGTREAGHQAITEAFDAYRAASDHYGRPFEVQLERRLKVTAAVLFLTVLQLALFVVIGRRWRRWQWPVFAASCGAWLALCLFLHLRFLAID